MNKLVSKNPILRFKIQYYQGGTPKGGINLGIKSKEEIESNNNRERNLASHHFSKVFSDNEGIWDGIKHLARGILHGYNGYLDPETQYQTGAPTILPGRTPTQVPSVRKVGTMLKNKLFLRGYNKSGVRISSVPIKLVPEGERITFFKNADGSRTPRYYDKKYGHWIDVEMQTPKTTNVAKVIKAEPAVEDVSIVNNNTYIPEYDYNNDVMMVNSAFDDAYNFDPGVFDLFKKGGTLISKNPVLRFKLGKKIIKAYSGVPMFYGIAPLKNWKGKKGELNLTDEEKAILALHGIKYDNAYDLLSEINYLLNRLYLHGIGKNDNENYQEYIAQDNKWGDQSLAGLNWLIEKLKRTPKPILDGNGMYIYDSPTSTDEINYDYNLDWNEWEKNGGKEKILRESDKFREPYGKSYIEHLSPNPQQWMKGEGEYVLLLPLKKNPTTLPNPEIKIKPTRTNNYSRKDIRNLIKSENFNAYNYTGALRKALRKYLNGESDDTSLLDGTDLARFTLPYRKQGGQLVSKNPIERFKTLKALKGMSFKLAHAKARANKQRYFNWTDDKGVTRMYNSKSAGNDTDYESFIDNMNEMSALLPTDNTPKHLGWEKNNDISNEVRGNDKLLGNIIGGTENTVKEPIIIGSLNKSKNKKTIKPQSKVQYNVVYNVPMGAIEYIGRDGRKYWMRLNHSTGEYYYIDRNQPISYAKNIVPEGYIIPGANIKINKGTNIGKLALGLLKKYF